MKKFIAILFFLTLYITSHAQQKPDLTNWKIETLPVGDILNRANQSRDDWIIIKKNDKWQIEQNTSREKKVMYFINMHL